MQTDGFVVTAISRSDKLGSVSNHYRIIRLCKCDASCDFCQKKSTVTFVAGEPFRDVVSLVLAGTAFGDVEVSLFVAGATFGDVQSDSCCSAPCTGHFMCHD